MKNNELKIILSYLSNTTGTGLSVGEILTITNTREDIKSKLKEYNEATKSITESSDEEEAKTEKLIELNNMDVEIKGLNFLSKEKAVGCCPPKFNQYDIDKVIELLSN